MFDPYDDLIGEENVISLSKMKEVIERFNTLFPRNKIPNYCYTNKVTFERLKEHLRPLIKEGHLDFVGLPVYVRESLPDGDVQIYDLNGDLMRTVRID